MENKKRLKVVHILPFYYPVIGGMEEVVKNMCEMLAARGHEVDVFTSNHDHLGRVVDAPAHEIVNGVHVYRFKSFFQVGFMVFFPGFISKLFKKKYDLIDVHVYRHNHTDLAAWSGKFRNIPTVLHGHGPFSERENSKFRKMYCGFYDAFARFLILRSARLVVAITQFEKKEYLKRGGKADKIAVIPNGIPDFFYKERASEKFIEKFKLSGKKIILSVGRLHHGKRFDVLIRGFARIAKQYPDAVLVIAGPDGGTGESLSALARELRIEENYRWIGPLGVKDDPGLLEAYAAADFFVSTSDYESFGLVLVEAMAAGKPVVAMNAGGPTEIVHEGRTGFLVEPGNDQELAEKMGKLLGDLELVRSMGQESLKEAQQYRISRIVDALEENYNRLTDGTY